MRGWVQRGDNEDITIQHMFTQNIAKMFGGMKGIFKEGGRIRGY